MLLEEAISLMKILEAGVLVPKGTNTNKNQQC